MDDFVLNKAATIERRVARVLDEYGGYVTDHLDDFLQFARAAVALSR